MKKVLIGLGVVIVVVAIVVYVFLGNLNDIVKAAVEKVGSDLTQTSVTLENVDIELTSGKGALRGFRVTNPSGFSADDAFRFDEVSVAVDITSIRSDPVVIRELVIQGPVVVYEFAKEGGSNLETINRRIEARTRGSGGTSAGGSSDAPNIVIENLYLRNGVVAVRAPMLDDRIEVPLPAIHLTDIGKDGKGATPGEVADQLMSSILVATQRAVANAQIDIEKITGAAMEEAERAADEARRALEGAGSGTGGALDDAARDADDTIRGIMRGIGGN